MDPAARCQELRRSLERPGAPGDLGALARAAGIAHVRLEAIGIDGMLVPSHAGLVAVVSTRITPSRQRFTLAHEAGHAALGTGSAACFSVAERRAVTEREANRFAAEALLPASQIKEDFADLPPTGTALARVSAAFRVSLETAALRLIELGMWEIAFVVWRVLPRPGSTAKLRVDWSAKPPTAHIFIPRFAAAPDALRQQWDARQSGRATVPLTLGSLSGSHGVDSICGEDALYSLIDVCSGE